MDELKQDAYNAMKKVVSEKISECSTKIKEREEKLIASKILNNLLNKTDDAAIISQIHEFFGESLDDTEIEIIDSDIKTLKKQRTSYYNVSQLFDNMTID